MLGYEGGKFLSRDFAVKGRVGIFSSGSTIATLMAGAKYYLGGVAPLDLNLGILTGDGFSEFAFEAHIGYAIPLADNIYFEPKVGASYVFEDAVVSIKLPFVMMF